ncbi:MAG: tyrosine-type recombinase/integrase [Ignavibacteriaceae bacterium]
MEKKKREKTQNITVLKGLDEFLDTKSDKKESTRECYELAVKKFIKVMGDMKISEIDAETIKIYYDSVKYEKTKSKKLISRNTIASYNNQLLVIFNFFRDKGYIEKNPFEHKEIQINEVITFSDKSIKNILAKLKKKNIEHYKIIAMLLITGLRVSEMINLSFSDIDFDEDIINFKNEKEDRNDRIPLYPILKEFILTYWKDYEGKLFNYKSRHSLHFFKKLLKDEHLEKYSLHTLRKTYITKLLNSKISIYDAKTLSRHKNIKTTFKHYANAELRRMGNEVNRLTNLGTLLGTGKKKVLKLVKKVRKLDTAA